MYENPANLQCAVSIFGNHWHALELDSFWQCVQTHHILYILTLDNLDLSVQRFHGCLDKNNRNPNLGLDTFVDPTSWVEFWCDSRWNLTKHDTIWRILSSLFFSFSSLIGCLQFYGCFISQRNLQNSRNLAIAVSTRSTQSNQIEFLCM